MQLRWRVRPGSRDTEPFHGRISGRVGWAVQREWPDGTHELFGFGRQYSRVGRRLDQDAVYWRRGPLRPVGHAVVRTSWYDFWLHLSPCSDATCRFFAAGAGR